MPISEWPQLESNQEIDPAIAKEEKVSIDPTYVLVGKQIPAGKITPLLSTEWFSTKTKSLRTYAWILRFVSNMKAVIGKQEPNLGPLEGVELRCAENHKLRVVQDECFLKKSSILRIKGE